MEGNLDDNLLMLVVSIILGVAIHVLTFKVINHSKLKWMKAWIYKPETEYIKNSKSGELTMIMPSIKKMYEKDKHHNDDMSTITLSNDTTVEYYDWTFDFAYYYLEVNDKITQAKNFQSFYFLFRNLFVMSMVHFKIMILLVITSFFVSPENSIINWNTLFMFVLLAIITCLIVTITGWLRSKMIDRVLWSYYVDRRTKEIDNQK
jgi:hypothetical protein